MSDPFAIRMPPDIQSVQVGGHMVVFIDDFLARFEPCDGADEKRGYPGMRAPVPSAYSESLTALLDPLIKVNFDVPEDLPGKGFGQGG